jgi:hypothetical protein
MNITRITQAKAKAQTNILAASNFFFIVSGSTSSLID